MNATPAHPTAGDGSARARPPVWDLPLTIALLGVQVMLSLMFAFGVMLTMGNCYPGACDEGQLAFTGTLEWTGLLAVAVVTSVVSIVLLVFHKRAFYVPILGIAAMFAWGAIWNNIVLHALYG